MFTAKKLVRPIAETMLQMGMKRAAVVHGSGLDKVAIHGETIVAEIKDGAIHEYVAPADFGLNTHRLKLSRAASQKKIKPYNRYLAGKGTSPSWRSGRQRCSIDASIWSRRSKNQCTASD
ncbi:hypothetical protein O9929_19880 [Vibrio lentus]|nr:hypothetical protein [Vibrio lentus]